MENVLVVFIFWIYGATSFVYFDFVSSISTQISSTFAVFHTGSISIFLIQSKKQIFIKAVTRCEL